MGIGPGYKYRGCSSSPYSVPGSNPVPSNFKVVDWRHFRNRKGKVHLLVKVKYPDATNYEGVKIMVYEGFDQVHDLLERVNYKLDPHFSANRISPIARFAPTDEGWALAIKFAGSL